MQKFKMTPAGIDHSDQSNLMPNRFANEDTNRKKIEGVQAIDEYMHQDLNEFPKMLRTKLQGCLEDYTRE